MRRILASTQWIAAAITQFLLITPSGAQTTIHVPADQPTIQQAIAVAQNGDTVLVAPGTYTENIDFQGKAITVASSGGAAVTTIDGGNKASVVTFQTGEGPNSMLNGFTITNGTSTFEGAGIFISSASPTIDGNVITANHGCSGNGIAIAFASPVIRNNTISNNTATTCSGGDGAGISVRGAGSAQILNNTITGNQIPSGGSGGGISLFGAGTPTISGNTIQHNSVFNDGGGISLANQSDANIIQNLITDNTAMGSGGGIAWTVPSGDRGPWLVNNTIANNTASSGSAVFSQGFVANVQMINNLFYSQAVAAVDCDTTFNATPPILSFNDAFTGSGPAFIGSCSGVVGSNNNITADPLFVNPSSTDYHLQSGSPAIDAGNNGAPNLPQKDLDSNPRVAVGAPPACADVIDLGVYEFVLTNTASLTPNSLAFGSLQVGSSSAPQSAQVGAQGCVQISSVTVNGDFTQTNNCPALLTTGNSCSVQVVFTPSVIGQRNGTLSLSGNFSAQTIPLSGTGLQAIPNVSPQSLAFGNQNVTTTSAAQVVTLSNTGNAPLQISAISATGDFAQTNNCGVSLPGGSSCTVNVTFTPSAAGLRTGTLSIQTNPALPASVSLSGTGVDYSLTASPGSATVNAGQTAQYTVTAAALGGTFADSVSLSCSGLPRAASCSFSPGSVSPGSSSASSQLAISTTRRHAGRGTPAGTFPITVTGSSGTITHTVVVQLIVN